jgi:hypothetical protein
MEKRDSPPKPDAGSKNSFTFFRDADFARPWTACSLLSGGGAGVDVAALRRNVELGGAGKGNKGSEEVSGDGSMHGV